MENSIGLVVIEIISYRQKNPYIIGKMEIIWFFKEITGPTHIKRAHSLTTWTGSGKKNSPGGGALDFKITLVPKVFFILFVIAKTLGTIIKFYLVNTKLIVCKLFNQ